MDFFEKHGKYIDHASRRQVVADRANIMVVIRGTERRDGVNSLKTAALSSETRCFQFIPADRVDFKACVQIMSRTIQWSPGLLPESVCSFVGVALPQLFVETNVQQYLAQMDTHYLANALIAHVV